MTRMMNGYEIREEYGHYNVYLNGNQFICSADTFEEAVEEACEYYTENKGKA